MTIDGSKYNPKLSKAQQTARVETMLNLMNTMPLGNMIPQDAKQMALDISAKQSLGMPLYPPEKKEYQSAPDSDKAMRDKAMVDAMEKIRHEEEGGEALKKKILDLINLRGVGSVRDRPEQIRR